MTNLNRLDITYLLLLSPDLLLENRPQLLAILAHLGFSVLFEVKNGSLRYFEDGLRHGVCLVVFGFFRFYFLDNRGVVNCRVVDKEVCF